MPDAGLDLPWTQLPWLPVAALLGVGLFAWSRRGPRGADEPWHPAWDGGLVLAAAVALPLWAWSRSSPTLIPAGDALAADFSDYCTAIAVLRDGAADPFPPSRSLVVAALLAPVAARVGLLSALQLGALAGTALVGAGLALWGRAATGQRSGAIATVALAVVASPLAALPRQLTFYPELAGIVALATGLVAVSASTRSWGVPLLAGACTGLVLSADARLLPVGLPLALVGAMAALAGPPERLAARGLAFGLPVALSWPLAAVLPSLLVADPHFEPAGYLRIFSGLVMDHDPTLARAMVAEVSQTDLRWGHTHPADVPRLLDALWLGHEVSPAVRMQEPTLARSGALEALLGVVAGAGVLATLAGLARPRRLLAVPILVLPFAVSLSGALVLLPRLRGVTIGALCLPVVLAAGAWGLGGLARLPRQVGYAVAAATWIAALGLIDSPLHPDAGWRVEVIPGTADLSELQPATPDGRGAACAAGLDADREAGLQPEWLGPTRP